MARRHNHYEAAFEDYLRSEGIAYVAVNEQRRPTVRQCDLLPSSSTGKQLSTDAPTNIATLKNVDFLLSPRATHQIAIQDELPLSNGKGWPSGEGWLIDVKGRRFPSGSQYWRNWTTADEMHSLAEWERQFGNSFRAALIFAYHLVGTRSPLPAEELHPFRGEAYAFVAVPLTSYRQAAKLLSPKWQTFSVPTPTFRQIAQPLRTLLSSPTLDMAPAEDQLIPNEDEAEHLG